ncbi:MAG: hypothetical protein A3C02_01190 [Candidatus Andersenbacteria bacterium RIFCSPHIGHO2_02_FULL_45_11]|uniref:DUF7884 domain-containing protein n=1 Tax=Candidatus Andersenbacteria bacterium RIFCSPHIGHO2_12_FULL_45_11 TaxID=1797281 RepID=A0A1G1X2I1_9BACT|nr:MAG: hypothetical protein A2805_03350 [Candidatus Andersenbacteria bacterium RIFCSPHIGHO2_01_FULL_46_36]OGY32384.1 MAG: hypothetical protein A3C02_01190 [Candidatus Andersenbacteria bacterium RIFCSPHIGHO2_02_FULL_45_11]OGY34222.1 MAG: hypothetical protein A3D99_03655 [Candidatus Andersenbacteria bacterium RIFCSPHIGHO2_12_FULL_45_11]
MLGRLKNNWNGPAVTLIVGKKEIRIGRGKSLVTVRFKSRWALSRLAFSPSLGFGEGYMDGKITVEGNIMDLFEGFVQSDAIVPTWIRDFQRLLSYLPIPISGAVKNAQSHYDIGNDFYGLWLDESRTYTCAYFLHEDDTLSQAQFQKNDLVCKKVRLERGMTLLDIGCGWGGAIFHAAVHYGADVTGVTPAKEQAAYILDKAKQLGLQDRVHVIIDDWRNIEQHTKNTKFDRVISIGMFEHVGRAQYAEFFALWKRALKDNGISLLHTIGRKNEENSGQDPWMRKYIFPGGYVPLLHEIIRGAGKEELLAVDVENLWQHYAKTLNWWEKNVQGHKEEIVNMFDERFFRMWTLYLKVSEAGFIYGDMQLYQTVILGKDANWPLNREVTK